MKKQKNIIVPNVRIRRRDTRRLWIVGGVLFVGVFLFTFLATRFKTSEETEAANLAKFDAGYIISDWQMGNYTSMSEAEIQKFLTSKNSCANTDYNYYQRLSAGPSYKWHFENGHFVCLSEEKFGDGEVIGSGETAAHIIWQAAQDYKINPQVLIVLLQKETGLITDPIPNNGDYRKATGYGCPDTAPCSSEYYGFKNQIRKAAALFRTVLNGGWTNYPLGENYVQYNPNRDCGGTTVNIRSLATSALYRYTPYQPNAAALSAGRGYGDYCSAYGNRNFYQYFEDWFGGITRTKITVSKYGSMKVARYLYVPKGARYVDPVTSEMGMRTFASFEYFTYSANADDKLCLAIGDGKNCYLYEDLEEVEVTSYEKMSTPRMLILKNNAKYFDTKAAKYTTEVRSGTRLIFQSKTNVNGKLCLKTIDGEKGTECIFYDNLNEIPEVKYSKMKVPRDLYVQEGAKMINTLTGISETIKEGEKIHFDKLAYWFGELCLTNENNKCILYSDLNEINVANFSNMAIQRYLKVKNNTTYYDAEIGIKTTEVKAGAVLYFMEKNTANGGLCLKDVTQKATSKNCILYTDLQEIDNFTKMAVARDITIKSGATYFNLETKKVSEEIIETPSAYFVDKITIDNKLCLRTKEDANNNLYRCIMYANLSE